MDHVPLTPDEHAELALRLHPDEPPGSPGHALLLATMAQGFSREVAHAGLLAELSSWRNVDIAALFAELPPGRRPATVLVLAPRTLPASAMRQVFLARQLGAEVLFKPAAGQESLGEALHLADPRIIPSPFDSQDVAALDRLIARADTVVVLGSDETIAAVRPRVPASKAFAGHGHKVSAHWLPDLRDKDLPTLATHIAADLLAWDQAGCLSPQVLWAGPDAEMRALLLTHLSQALSRLEPGLPLAEPAHSSMHAGRRVMSTLAAMLGEPCDETLTATLALHPEPAFRSAPGPRALWILPAEPQALAEVMPHISTLATLGPVPPDVTEPVRLCAPGEMQRPPLSWRQDGLHPLGSLLLPA